ncbi:larval cuticle protein 65Ag1-like [Chrysoperla carnea]|uniref:larval cuticle protein 65Ag1-like n=1 Tax=Chrysoperla carnea TaxID=189513 RepID=UPI001D08EEA2|nr:larval cuticle protein 65Ag1-like [Chrysoperla carnea]
MKFVIVFAALFAVALAKPLDDKDVEVKAYTNDNIGTGEYTYNVVLSDGQSRSESASLAQLDKDETAIRVSGEFRYLWEGVEYLVKYYADETGFHAEGAHLPKAPSA